MSIRPVSCSSVVPASAMQRAGACLFANPISRSGVHCPVEAILARLPTSAAQLTVAIQPRQKQ